MKMSRAMESFGGQVGGRGPVDPAANELTGSLPTCPAAERILRS